MKIRASVFFAVSIYCVSTAAFAQSDAGKEALYVKSLAATCANCHGTNGVAVTRPATVMHQLSKGYSDAQIEVIATYFAAQKK